MSEQETIATSWHPLAGGVAPDWASGWGEDEYGVFVEITVKEVTQALRWCPPGRFLMGSPEDEPERYDDEGPQTEITFRQGFWLFEAPVTQALYEAVTGETPSKFKGADLPVETVSWDDAVTFLSAINKICPDLNLRLPSEAEWEYACRAGSVTPFEPNVARHFAGKSITPSEVNCDGNYPYDDDPEGLSRQKTTPARPPSFRPNAWGLWQMHGNIWEWCADRWSDSHAGASPDGAPRQRSQQHGESLRVLRGGSWSNTAGNCRSAYRGRRLPENRSAGIGFRPARGQATRAQAGAAEPPGGSDKEGPR